MRIADSKVTRPKRQRRLVTHEEAQRQYQRYLELVAPKEVMWDHFLWHSLQGEKPLIFLAFMSKSDMVISEAVS